MPEQFQHKTDAADTALKKAELITATAETTGYQEGAVREVLDAAAEHIKRGLAAGRSVFIMGLGKLTPSQRGERRARHMRTGEPVMVPPRTVVLYRPSESVLSAANPSE